MGHFSGARLVLGNSRALRVLVKVNFFAEKLCKSLANDEMKGAALENGKLSEMK
jgi:hypothetical protein